MTKNPEPIANISIDVIPTVPCLGKPRDYQAVFP
jgi:hypothetical protein